MNIRIKYSIPDNAKILLYVGNINENKNQEQMIEAFGLLSEADKCNTFENTQMANNYIRIFKHIIS